MFLEWIYENELRDWDWHVYTAAAAKSLQSCPTLRDPIDGSSPGSPVPGILQARTLEWADISFSNAWKWKVEVKSLSCARLWVTPWTAAHQAPPSLGFSRQEHWSGLPFPSPMHESRHTANIGWVNEKSKELGPEGWLSCNEPKGHREGMLGGGQAWAKAQAAGKPSSEVREEEVQPQPNQQSSVRIHCPCRLACPFFINLYFTDVALAVYFLSYHHSRVSPRCGCEKWGSQFQSQLINWRKLASVCRAEGSSKRMSTHFWGLKANKGNQLRGQPGVPAGNLNPTAFPKSPQLKKERWSWWTYLQGSRGDTDIENRDVGTVGEGEGGTDGGSSMETYTWPYVK